jgi:hypothetical protein
LGALRTPKAPPAQAKQEHTLVTKRATQKGPPAADEEGLAGASTCAGRRGRLDTPEASAELATDDARFVEVLELVEPVRNRGYQAVNSELVTLYWQPAEHTSRKFEQAEWGDAAGKLAATLMSRYPCMRSLAR